jgi:hypothetical protein
MREAMADGEEQSIRILPSLSTVMKAKEGSTMSLVMVRFSPYISAIGSQYAMPEPPSGSTPILTPASRMRSMSTTLRRSAR